MHLKGKWVFQIIVLGMVIGATSSAFLMLLQYVTETREKRFFDGDYWFLGLLPLSGAVCSWVYEKWGKGVENGVICLRLKLQDSKAEVPLRLVPLIFVSSLCTHVFGGSAGREGVGVQMGGTYGAFLSKSILESSLASGNWIRAGVAAGFSAMFGTPFAGTAYALESFTNEVNIDWKSLIPSLATAFVANETAKSLGIIHSTFTISASGFQKNMSLSSFAAALGAGVVFGIVANMFLWQVNFWKKSLQIFVKKSWIKPLIGGSIVVMGTFWLRSDVFLGLGVKVIESSFHEPLPWWYFLNKMAFTSVTLGSGFQGGEATPLFFIGSTLGNSLSHFFPLPYSLLAGMGFVGVFSGVSKAPIACSILAIELFGFTFAPYLVLACFISAYASRTFESFSRLNGKS